MWLSLKYALMVLLKQYEKLSVCDEKEGFCWQDDQNEGQQPYASCKTICFVKYLGSFLTDFHETSITGILLMR